MKKTMMILALLVSVVSTTQASQKTIKGKDAAVIMKALEIISKDESDEQSGISINSGTSQEGIGNDNVTAQWAEISGKIGLKSVECSSQIYMTYKVSLKNKNTYTNVLECKIK